MPREQFLWVEKYRPDVLKDCVLPKSLQKEFEDILKSGEMQSGTTRSITNFLPGVFTEQGERDEVFDSLAETSARAYLKETGDTRPTDADVKGMKAAMFGVGKDEGSNIKLLENYIAVAERSEKEFQDMREWTKANGTIRGFSPADQVVSEDDGDGDIEFLGFE